MKTSLIVLVALALLILGILVALKRRGAVGTSAEAWPFYAKRPLTAPEQILYFRLVRALPDHIVLAQVQVSRVLGVKKGFGFNHWNNRINRLSYDFVVCSKDASVIAAIELDDKSHEAASRVEADARKTRATKSAGIRLVRWHVKAIPDEAAIQVAILDASSSDSGPPTDPQISRF